MPWRSVTKTFYLKYSEDAWVKAIVFDTIDENKTERIIIFFFMFIAPLQFFQVF